MSEMWSATEALDDLERVALRRNTLRPPKVTHQIDVDYGTDLTLINGVPITFTKIPDRKDIRPRKAYTSKDE